MGMQNIASSDWAAQKAVELTRQMIEESSFANRHRVNEKAFTRQRKLPFSHVMVMLLQKTVRSIQLHLHDFFAGLLSPCLSAVASSWCEARLKLKHTAFIELNERAILEVAYGGREGFAVRRWKGHRLLAIDSSLVRLPNEKPLGEQFGWLDFTNPPGHGGRCPEARLSVLTDVLNRLAIETIFVGWKECERKLALTHLERLEAQDVGVLDRGFASYELWAQFVARERWFICRCPRKSFAVINRLFVENQDGQSLEATLSCPASKRVELCRQGLPESIQVRLVTVRLQSGELEVLATNLLDPSYSAGDFSQAYKERWGIETYYGLIKSRLALENFSGVSVEAIRQDLHATVFLSNLETLLTGAAQRQLQEDTPGRKNQAQVNHAVSFHAIKSHAIPLLLSQEPVGVVLARLQKLFLHTPVCCRPERQVPRRKKSPWRCYNYQRNVKKTVF